ncbi:MAG: hypothetical protein M1820_002354 [Bogoriella megaspora]|nr:MAG: hypothetical protein M1820_002354 [Bogoriella megaspora]
MPARKRTAQEMESGSGRQPSPPVSDELRRLRNMWQFASLVQYIYMFGKAVKVDDDLDVDEMEQECLKPQPSEKLSALGLALLKFVSSHRGLTPEIFDEYTRRQYLAKAPHRNPFGEDELPKKFNDFDVFTKIRILHQLSVWTLNNADRIRERMPEQKDFEQTNWRIEPQGWDAEDRAYFVLDDDRLYRQTDAPLPAPPVKTKAKAKSKPKHSRSTRSNKRRKVSRTVVDTEDEEEEPTAAPDHESEPQPDPEDDDFGGKKWECIAVTLEEYQSVLEDFRRSRDSNERRLYSVVSEMVLPVIERKAEEQARKVLRKQKELENLQKMATAKRSSRLADKHEKKQQEEEAAAAEQKRHADLAMARKEQERQQKMEAARESRMMTREQRLKEREVKRILHEEELARLEEDSKKADNGDARVSERHMKAEKERRQKELQKLTQEDDWVFDCAVCGKHGENYMQDDGSHSIACEKCNVWQHSKCHGIAVAEAERDDFHFVCADCKRRDEEAKRPKTPLKIRLSSSRNTEDHPMNGTSTSNITNGISTDGPIISRKLESVMVSPPRPHHPDTVTSVRSGPSLSPQGQGAAPPGMYRPNGIPDLHQPHWNGHPPDSPARPSSSSQAMGLAITNGMTAGSPSPQNMTNGVTNGTVHSELRTPQQHMTNGTSHYRPPSAGSSIFSNDPFRGSFGHQRPPSAHSNHATSPVKQTPSHPSPQPTYQPHSSPFTAPSNPHTSFPPGTQQNATIQPSPIKQSSSPPNSKWPPYSPPQQLQQPQFPNETRANIFPPSVAPPTKHEVPRSTNSSGNSFASSFGNQQGLTQPPNLSPSVKEQVLDPPVKRNSPVQPQGANGSGEI